MENKSAVDFLIELLPQIDWDDPYYRGIWQEAKEIEKFNIIKSYQDNHDLGHLYGNNGEQYYKETYDSNTKI